MTLQEMASAVRNHVVDGLDGISNTSFSVQQLQDEILLVAPAIMLKMANEGILDMTKLYQRIDGIRLECVDVSANCEVPTDVCAPHFMLPNVNLAAPEPISFLGTIDSTISFKVYYDREFRFHKYRLATARAPFAWVSTRANNEGMYDVYLFNLGKFSNLQFLSVDALFDNPYDLLKTPYYDQFSSSEFYAPSFVQSQIIDALTAKYVEYYRKLHMAPKPNTQQP